MFGTLFSRARSTHTLIVDVGPGSAAAAIISNTKTAQSVVAQKRVSTSLEQRDRAQEIAATRKAMSEAILNVVSTGRAVSNLFVSIQNPWSVSHTAEAERTLERETTVSPQLVGELAKEAMSKIQLDRTKMYEAGVIRMEFNGYATTKPKGKTAHHIKVVVLASEVDQDVLSALQSACEEVIPGIKPVFRSSTRALSVYLRSSIRSHRNYAHIELTDEALTCSVIKKDMLLDQATTALGTRSIARAVAGPNGLPEETLTLMRLVGTDSCTNQACATVVSALTVVEPQFVKQMGDMFGKLAQKNRLPNEILLSAHPDVQAWLSSFLSKLDFSQFTVTMRPFTVRVAGAEAITTPLQYAPGIIKDDGIAIAAALVNNDGLERK